MNHGPLAHYLLVHYDAIVVDNADMVGAGGRIRGGCNAHKGGPEHSGGEWECWTSLWVGPVVDIQMTDEIMPGYKNLGGIDNDECNKYSYYCEILFYYPVMWLH